VPINGLEFTDDALVPDEVASVLAEMERLHDVSVDVASEVMDSSAELLSQQRKIRAKSEMLAVETQDAETEMEERHAFAVKDESAKRQCAQESQRLASVQAILIVRHSTNGDST